MNGYTKLFASIITSTIWGEDNDTRIVWITLLASADKNGEVQASIPGLARISGVTVEACEKAIEKFLSPDPYSRTKDDEGRRIEPIEGGWILLNHRKYRELASHADMATTNAERQKRHRERQKRNAGVTDSNGSVTHPLKIADAESDSDAESEREEKNGFALLAQEVERRDPPLFQQLMDEWRKLPSSIPQIRMMSDSRVRELNTRAKKREWREHWKEAVRMIAESPFLTGKNDKGWTASVDWFLKPDSVAMILEGKYADKTPKKTEDPDFWRKHL